MFFILIGGIAAFLVGWAMAEQRIITRHWRTMEERFEKWKWDYRLEVASDAKLDRQEYLSVMTGESYEPDGTPIMSEYIGP